MSKAKKNRNRGPFSPQRREDTEIEKAETREGSHNAPQSEIETADGLGRVSRYLRAHLWAVALIAFLSIGAIGAALKYLDEDAQKQKLLAAKDRSALSSINPFLAPPTPTPTPQLSREYLYAGSRLLAVEDANANAAPPADLAVWRPSTGVWYVLGGPGSQQTFFTWGNGTTTPPDKPVPGDYDGDGKTDFAVFRPTTGQWWIVKSSDGNSYVAGFGSSGDLPAQADYDGDGKTDQAVYRPSTGVYYVLPSSTGSSYYQSLNGQSSDLPAPADYDGDGKADIALYHTGTQTFQSINSTNGATFTTGTIAGTNVVSGDYDGDGKADYGMFNSSAGAWNIRYSTTGSVITTNWGASGDQVVQNDYDGDGKCDIAIWRPSTGYWWILQSHDSSLRTAQWGSGGDPNTNPPTPSDIPVPAYYRR